MRTRLLASVAMACMATAAFAQPSPSGNLERLSNFKTTGASMDIPTTPQTGPKAERSRRTWRRIKLPPGFKIEPLRDRARCAPHGGRPAGRGDLRRHAQDQGLGGDRPRQGPRRRRGEGVRAVARFHDPERRLLLQGRLPVSSPSRTGCSIFPAAEFFYEGPDVAAVPGRQAGRADPAGRGKLQPHGARPAGSAPTTSSTSRSASRSTCRRPTSWTLYKKDGHRRHHPHGPRRQEPRGLRRAACATRSAWTSTPRTRALWFTDNQVDGMGDDMPPGELNRADQGRA